MLIEALERFYFGAFKDYVKDVAPRETLPVRKHFKRIGLCVIC